MTKVSFTIFTDPDTTMKARQAFRAWGMRIAYEFEKMHEHRNPNTPVVYTRRDPIDPQRVWKSRCYWTQTRKLNIQLDSEPVKEA